MTLDAPCAYHCCVACMNNPRCSGTLGIVSTEKCYLHISDTCSASNEAFGLYTIAGQDPGIYASNGNCGRGRFYGQYS